MESSTALTSQQLEDLQLFLKDWLRHTGRTQADLRRALRASSIRMPVLLEALQRIHDQQGLGGLAEHLCEIETLWRSEEGPESPQAAPAPRGGANPLDQLDLLLDEIRGAAEEHDPEEDGEDEDGEDEDNPDEEGSA
ncbi:MAG: hypothetical protein VKP63_08495 [Cyanobacteriota bacterium]|nr:hypothetical protein [Cyanobacteriota bacterium]